MSISVGGGKAFLSSDLSWLALSPFPCSWVLALLPYGLLQPFRKEPGGLVFEGLAATAGRWAWRVRARLSLWAAG